MIQRLARIWNSFLNEDEAVTTVEYALLLALIAMFCVSGITSSGSVQKSLWTDTADSIVLFTN